MLLVCASLVSAQTREQDKVNPQTIEELRAAIDEVLVETQTQAVGIALVDQNGPVWVLGLGKANIEEDFNADENTMFRIGSTSKMYVSLAILKLQQEGRLSLKDKVKDLIPEIEFKNPWENTSPILVEHLLEHTTGWGELHLPEFAHNDPNPISLKDALDFHPDSRISRWVPGTRMSYSNIGPPVAAYIVEKVTGQTFESYVKKNFFQPMGMENMTYFATETYKQLGATLYIDGEPQDYWNIIVRPSGSINASPKDMAKMIQFFINRGRVDSLQIINEESLQRMESPRTSLGAKAGLEFGYGLANGSTPYKSFTYRSHNGGVNGGSCDFAYLPEYNIGYAVMINSGNRSAMKQIIELIRGFQTKNLESKEIIKPIKFSNQKQVISGYYIPINPRIQMFDFLGSLTSVQRITIQGDTIIQKGLFGGRTNKSFQVNDKLFMASETGKINMARVTDPIAGETLDTGLQVLKKVSQIRVFGQMAIGALWILMMVSSLIYGIVLAVRYGLGKTTGRANIKVRLWPVISSLLIVTTILIFISISIESLGTVSLGSMSITICTIGFALFSVWSLITVIKERTAKLNRLAYWYSAVLSVLHVVVTSYLMWHGVIGIQTWS